MYLLNSSSPKTMINQLGEDLYLSHYGYLLAPRRWSTPYTGSMWAADNDAFSSWDRDLFIAMLRNIGKYPGCKFVCAPDVVGDARATFRRFLVWKPVIKYYGLPVAYVLQDGQEQFSVPYSACDAVFIGGTTEWKLSESAARIALEAKQRGKWVHMGRVNSRKRLMYAQSLNCDSVDGSGYARFRKNRLPETIPVMTTYQYPIWEGLLCR